MGQNCSVSRINRYEFWNGTKDIQPGQTVSLNVSAWQPPGLREEVPPACIDELPQVDPKVGAISRKEDGSIWLTIAKSALSPQTVQIDAKLIHTDARARSDLSIYRQAEQPLVGFWRQELSSDQDQPPCRQEQLIGEVHFSANGEFTVTRKPFETYKDYWGLYRFDSKTSTLALDVIGGNEIPEGIKSGQLILEKSFFQLGEASFGEFDGASECTTTFYRYERGW